LTNPLTVIPGGSSQQREERLTRWEAVEGPRLQREAEEKNRTEEKEEKWETRLNQELNEILINEGLIARTLCEFRRTSRNRRYAPAGRLLRGVWPSTMYNDHAL
jgi:hypothetical protein